MRREASAAASPRRSISRDPRPRGVTRRRRGARDDRRRPVSRFGDGGLRPAGCVRGRRPRPDARRRYPADAGARQQPALPTRTLVTRVWYPTAGPASATPVTDAALLTGKRFGLVVYSHGFGDTPAFAKYLAVPLASRGYVVAAPTFPLTNLATLGSPDGPYPADIVNQPADVSFV